VSAPFIDEIEIKLSSGKGGAGAVSFRREALTPRGGPDGGDGGRGGHVYFRARKDLNSLSDLRGKKHLKAADGQAGSGQNCSGKSGTDLFVEVPVGTQVYDLESGHLLLDLAEEGDHLFLEGGRGGKGNAFFKTSVNQAPEYAQPGEPGESRDVRLELKLIADVGIIGLPNAGKSTFIRRISNARPKVADYPFTTLVPNLGVVPLDLGKSFVVADIPGLIPGASQGAGLGIQFLKHIERTRVFVHLVSLNPLDNTDPFQAYESIQQELKSYDETHRGEEFFRPLSERRQVVVLNKADLLSPEEKKEIEERWTSYLGEKPWIISAATGEGVSGLLWHLATLVLDSASR
jgi:GTP-binding protein